MRRTNKKWELRKKRFWQNFDEMNGTYKINSNFMITFNGLLIIEDSAYEMYDATKQVNVLVTEHGVVNVEKSKGDWQMYRR